MNKKYIRIYFIASYVILFGCNPANKVATVSDQEVIVTVRAPDTGWNLKISQIRDTGSEILVLATLRHANGPAAQMLNSIGDSVRVTLPKRPIHVVVGGKTWLGPNSEPYRFLAANESPGADFENARVLYVAPPSRRSAKDI